MNRILYKDALAIGEYDNLYRVVRKYNKINCKKKSI